MISTLRRFFLPAIMYGWTGDAFRYHGSQLSFMITLKDKWDKGCALANRNSVIKRRQLIRIGSGKPWRENKTFQVMMVTLVAWATPPPCMFSTSSICLIGLHLKWFYFLNAISFSGLSISIYICLCNNQRITELIRILNRCFTYESVNPKGWRRIHKCLF